MGSGVTATLACLRPSLITPTRATALEVEVERGVERGRVSRLATAPDVALGVLDDALTAQCVRFVKAEGDGFGASQGEVTL